MNTGRNFSIKLKTQLIASFVGMSFIILLISSLFVYTSMENILTSQSEQENLKQFQQLEYNISTFQKQVDKISRVLIVSQDLQNLLDQKYSSDYERVQLTNSVIKSLLSEMANYDFIDSIYYYGENGSVIGVTSNAYENYWDSSKQGFFYHSELYNMTKSDNFKLHWYGGYTSADFHYSVLKVTNGHINYISAARSINLFGKQTATLVINVYEQFFTSIYNNRADENTIAQDSGNMYIMDNKGKIISCADDTMINTVSASFPVVQPDSKNGSMLQMKRNAVSEQIVYYHLSGLDWTLVNEIPYKYLLKDITQLRLTVIILFGGSMALVFGISMYWIFRITTPLNELTAAMREMEKGKLGLRLPETSKNELGMLGRQFNKMSASMLVLIDKVRVVEDEKRKLQIETLQAQINPHFLYNTLNTIKFMAVIMNANHIADSLTALGNVLRPIFKTPGILWSLADEIEYNRNYIMIMNYRYGEGIVINISIPEQLMECVVLRFIIQPIIENSILHGIFSQDKKGVITLKAVDLVDDISILVEDNGKGIEPEKITELETALAGADTGVGESSGIGLPNVHRRIMLHYGEKYGINIISEPGNGTQVQLLMPKVKRA